VLLLLRFVLAACCCCARRNAAAAAAIVLRARARVLLLLRQGEIRVLLHNQLAVVQAILSFILYWALYCGLCVLPKRTKAKSLLIQEEARCCSACPNVIKTITLLCIFVLLVG
jgi:hypothetical protein